MGFIVVGFLRAAIADLWILAGGVIRVTYGAIMTAVAALPRPFDKGVCLYLVSLLSLLCQFTFPVSVNRSGSPWLVRGLDIVLVGESFVSVLGMMDVGVVNIMVMLVVSGLVVFGVLAGFDFLAELDVEGISSIFMRCCKSTNLGRIVCPLDVGMPDLGVRNMLAMLGVVVVFIVIISIMVVVKVRTILVIFGMCDVGVWTVLIIFDMGVVGVWAVLVILGMCIVDV